VTAARTLPPGLPAHPAPALVRVVSLGLVLAGCPDCRLPVGVAGASGLAAALAAHRAACPTRRSAPTGAEDEDEVCPGCGCEAELYLRAGGWRCGDCLAEALLDDPALPAPVGRSRVRQPVPGRAEAVQVVAPIPRTPRQRRRRRRSVGRAVVA